MTRSTKIHYQIKDDVLFAHKPSNMSTHAPDIGKWGFAEAIERELKKKVYVVHRLDKTTSGSICFALSPEKAASLTESFKNHQVKKTYWFLTDRTYSAKDSEQNEIGEFEIFSNIEKVGKEFTNTPANKAGGNSHTVFKRVKRSPFFTLWQAQPTTGKPHQIRLHAAQAGIPILGDTLYGGTGFPRLCLHALELQIPGYETHTTPSPWFFERLGLLRDPELIAIISAIDDREKLFRIIKTPNNCLRLVHNEVPGIRCDMYGETLWVYWYRDVDPTQRDLERWHLAARMFSKKLMIRKMQNRGEDPLSQVSWEIPELEKNWVAEENGLKFLLKKDQGLSPGLFLDQRNNRLQVQEMSKNRKVLNLFSYTCGFSLNAAAGGASTVTSVDLSGNFLDWGKETFILNSFAAERYEFFKQDCVLFLRGTIKRQRLFDVIICDPPSFARFSSGKKKEVFKIDKNIDELIGLCLDVLADKGTLLFSCNYEKWSEEEFLKAVEKAVRKSPKGKKAKVTKADPSLDFERANEQSLMKAAWIRI